MKLSKHAVLAGAALCALTACEWNETEDRKLLHCKIEVTQLQLQYMMCMDAVRHHKVQKGLCTDEASCEGGMITDPVEGGMITDPAQSVFDPAGGAEKVSSCKQQRDAAQILVTNCRNTAKLCKDNPATCAP